MIGPDRDFIAIVGPTASGKSELAMRIASNIEVEIVSCDSVQVYRGFNIGTNKPSPSIRREITHHLIDLVDWHEDYDAARYRREAGQTIKEIRKRQKIPLLVGGCGLYFRALLGNNWHSAPPADTKLRTQLRRLSNTELRQKLQQLDPQRAEEIHPHDRVRLIRANEISQLSGKPLLELPPDTEYQLRPYTIYLKPPRAHLCQQIAHRAQQMLRAGLVAEVKTLLARGRGHGRAQPMRSIGYKQVHAHLTGEVPAAQLEQKIIWATRQYAKRQVTWFNKIDYDVCWPDFGSTYAL